VHHRGSAVHTVCRRGSGHLPPIIISANVPDGVNSVPPPSKRRVPPTRAYVEPPAVLVMLLAWAVEAAAVQMVGRKVRSAAMVCAARVMARLTRG
jgi:hypothetical protein